MAGNDEGAEPELVMAAATLEMRSTIRCRPDCRLPDRPVAFARVTLDVHCTGAVRLDPHRSSWHTPDCQEGALIAMQVVATESMQDSDGEPLVDPLWVETDAYGVIYDLGPAAAGLLGFSRRGAHARDLRTFFPGSYRLLCGLLREAVARPVGARYTLHPRDRRPVPVDIHISPAPDSPGADTASQRLRWRLTPSAA